MLRNWKTTLAGLIAVGSFGLRYLDVISDEQQKGIMALAAGFGLMVAKDAQKGGIG